MAEYSIIAVVVAAGVVAFERFVLKTGLFRTVQYWISMAIVAFFQTVVDGLLTKRPDPVVAYNEAFNSGLRFPGSIPVEDWLFGFSMVTLALLFWKRSSKKN
jgi:lycopene cyclase domain-containing protein